MIGTAAKGMQRPVRMAHKDMAMSRTGSPPSGSVPFASLLYLQHAYALSDEAVVARWVENPYWQHFCGETFFQHRLPLDPSSLTRWRQRIGEEGGEWLLTQTIEAGKRAGAVKGNDLKRVTVDSETGRETTWGVVSPANGDGRVDRPEPGLHDCVSHLASLSLTNCFMNAIISSRYSWPRTSSLISASRPRKCA